MDLTRFFRSRNESGSSLASPRPDRLLRPPPATRGYSSASSEDDNIPVKSEGANEHPRLGMYKKPGRRSHLTDRSSRAGHLENLRKSKRGAGTIQNRGIDINEVESEDEDDEVEFASVPPAASRPPLKAQQVTSSSAHSLPSSGVSVSNRQKRLDEFRQRRAAKKLAEAPKPPPFKVGVYKLEKSIKPENFKWNKNQSFAFGGGKTGGGSRTQLDTTSRPHFISTSVTNQSSTSVSTSTKQQSVKTSVQAKIRGKKENLRPRNIRVESVLVHDEAMEVDDGKEEPSSERAPQVEAKPLESTEENSKEDCQRQPFENIDESRNTILPQPLGNSIDNQPQSPTDQANVEPAPVDNMNITAEQVVEDTLPVNRQIKLIEEYQTSPINSHIDQTIFKTPIGITPISRMRGRSARRHTVSQLIDSLRSEICTERGSSSDRKRRRQGLPASRTPAEILGIDDLVLNDGSSPISELIRSNMIATSAAEKDENSAKLTSRKLDGDFDQIVAMEDDTAMNGVNSVKDSSDKNPHEEANGDQRRDEIVDSVKKDVPYFRSILKSETDRLHELCDLWNQKINDSIPEDVQDQILAVIGNSRLAMAKKGRFTQFETLIDDCEFQRGEQKTTCTDLEGFWDLIYIQMEKFAIQFRELELLEANAWKKPEAEKRKPVKRAIKVNRPKPNYLAKASTTAAKSRPPLRALIAQKRAEAAGEILKDVDIKSPTVQISIDKAEDNENCRKDEKTFEGGFFSVKTPKTPLRNSALNTPKSNAKPSSATILTPSRKPLSNRMSLLVMSTSKLRRSVCFDQFEKDDSTEQSPKSSGQKQPLYAEQIKPEDESKVKMSTPNRRGRPKKSESTPTVHFASRKTRKSSARFLSIMSAVESEENSGSKEETSTTSTEMAGSTDVNPMNPAHPSKIKFAEDETPSSAKPKSAGRKSKNRKSLIPDLISFDTPEPIARTPSRLASRRKSVAPTPLDSSLTEIPQISILPPTPRRSTRLSMAKF